MADNSRNQSASEARQITFQNLWSDLLWPFFRSNLVFRMVLVFQNRTCIGLNDEHPGKRIMRKTPENVEKIDKLVYTVSSSVFLNDWKKLCSPTVDSSFFSISLLNMYVYRCVYMFVYVQRLTHTHAQHMNV